MMPTNPPCCTQTIQNTPDFPLRGGWVLVEVLLVSTRSGIPLELVKFNLIQAEVLCDKERTGNPPPGVSTDTSATLL